MMWTFLEEILWRNYGDGCTHKAQLAFAASNLVFQRSFYWPKKKRSFLHQNWIEGDIGFTDIHLPNLVEENGRVYQDIEFVMQ